MTNNNQKLRELAVYVAERCQRKDSFGIVKLNKILFYSEVFSHRGRGATLTGSEYIKDIFGPVPKAMDGVLKSLEVDGKMRLEEREKPDGLVEKRPLVLRGPNLEIFSGDDLEIVERAIDHVMAQTANEISEETHALPAWGAARMHEVIPIAATLVPARPIPLTPAELERCQSVS